MSEAGKQDVGKEVPSGSPARDELPSYFVEPEPEPRWKRLLASRTFRALVIVAVLAGAILAGGPPIFREIKARRALAILAGMEEAMKLGDAEAAREKVRAGISMAPGDPRVLRILTRYKAAAGDPASFDTLAGWIVDGSATAAERLALAGIAIKRSDSVLAMRALDSLPARLPPDLEAGRILARANLLANEGRLAEAARKLREASLPPPQLRRIHLVLGSLLLTTSPETEKEGRRILEDLGNSDTGEGLAALRQIAARQITTQRAGGGTDRLPGHPLHTYSDVLLATQVRMLGKPEAARAKLVEELVVAARGHDISDRCSLARWLLNLPSPEHVREIFSPGDLSTSEDAFLAVADALAAQGRWLEVRALFNAEQRPPLDEAIRQLFLAKVAGQLGETEAVDGHWQTIRQNLPFSSPEVIRQIADYAGKSGRADSARQALSLLVEQKAATPGDFVQLVRMLPPNTHADEALALLDKFLAAYPKISELRSDQAYLSLLVGRDIEAAHATARELFYQKPEYLAYLSVLALAELRSGHPVEAARLYEGRQIAWNDSLPSFKAVRVAVLEANGLSVEAEALRATILPSALRPEEVELVRKPGVPPKAVPAVLRTK